MIRSAVFASVLGVVVGMDCHRLQPFVLTCVYPCCNTSVYREMDLIALMRKVPRLRTACVPDEITAVRILRLVNKEASRVALLSLRSYTLNLQGLASDSNISGASLLQQTHLDMLTVNLTLSGECPTHENGGDA